MQRGKLDPPAKSAADVAHTVVKVGLAAIPAVGGPLAEVFSAVIGPPIERRRNAWMEEVTQEIERLRESGLALERLETNEQFVSAVLQASLIAIRTHQAEKRRALRNAVVNVAKGQGPDEALQQIFLNLLDSFSELHLRVLKAAGTPKWLPNVERSDLVTLIEYNVPDLCGRREIADLIWEDLGRRGFVQPEQLSMGGYKRGNGPDKFTTGIGDTFLRFIEESV